MTTYKKESHLRSLIKGFSWRIIATTDTILIVLFITCFSENCDLENAVKIGFFEFFIKLIVYYIHERLWQIRINSRKISTKTIVYKTTTWRIVATTMTFLISGTILNAFDEIALIIALTELFTKFVLYYSHERLWLKLPLGKIRNYFFPKKK